MKTLLIALAVLGACLLARTAHGGEPGKVKAAIALSLSLPAPAAADPFSPTNKKACACTSPADCDCKTCGCAACATKTVSPGHVVWNPVTRQWDWVSDSTGPKIGDQKVTDDPSRPWTYGDGHEYGYDEMGWYRPVKAAPQSVRSAPIPPSYAQPAMGRVCTT